MISNIWIVLYENIIKKIQNIYRKWKEIFLYKIIFHLILFSEEVCTIISDVFIYRRLYWPKFSEFTFLFIFVYCLFCARTGKTGLDGVSGCFLHNFTPLTTPVKDTIRSVAATKIPGLHCFYCFWAELVRNVQGVPKKLGFKGVQGSF